MRVYIAGDPPPSAVQIAAEFGDQGVDPCVLSQCVAGKENILLRLAALSRCDAIWLPPDWRTSAKTRLEKAFADYQRIPEVAYLFPRPDRRL